MIWALIFLLCLPSSVMAANPFGMGRVDYFNSASLKQGFKKQQKESIDWRQPVLGADGKTNYYSPPSIVTTFLDDPTPENAQAYLMWQKEKSQKIQRAQEVLAEVMEQKT